MVVSSHRPGDVAREIDPQLDFGSSREGRWKVERGTLIAFIKLEVASSLNDLLLKGRRCNTRSSKRKLRGVEDESGSILEHIQTTVDEGLFRK